ENLVAVAQREHELGARGGVAGDVAGKDVDVENHDGTAFCDGGTADPLADGDAHTGGAALERTDHQAAGLGIEEVDAGPVEVRQAVEDERRHVGRIGDGVALAGEQARELEGQLAIERGLVGGRSGARSQHHELPAPSWRTKAMRSMLVAPGVPSGMPAVMAMRSPGRARASL